MIRISGISLPIGAEETHLLKQAAKQLGIKQGDIQTLQPVKQSIDARKKNQIRYIYTVDVSVKDEGTTLQYATGNNIRQVTPTAYQFPQVTRKSSHPPVVVGLGPAGLFAALQLAQAGLPCIILERGYDVDSRTQSVEHFWRTGQLDTTSNVQFGEGGAGTFSDGKLTTGTHDGRISAVMDGFVSFGAPKEILYSHKPHIGTDLLRKVVKNMRLELVRLGCDVRFGHQLTGLTADGDHLSEITVCSDGKSYRLPCDALILAPGHSARDTFVMLHDFGIPMESKQFAIGARIEHLQADIGMAQYGSAWSSLPPTDYKLACHLPNGRSAFSFCVCPGGHVVAAASENGQLVTNGMSYHARDGKNINGGFLVGVGPDDFGSADPLAGMRFQQHWERQAFRSGGENFSAPCQRIGDFLQNKPSTGAGRILPTYRPGVTWTSIDTCLPDFVTDTLRQALPMLERKVRGFSAPDALLTGIETRSSSPVRIVRNDRLQSSLYGLYPCGEGAGYAGGIVSAAVDGIRVAEQVATPL